MRSTDNNSTIHAFIFGLVRDFVPENLVWIKAKTKHREYLTDYKNTQEVERRLFSWSGDKTMSTIGF